MILNNAEGGTINGSYQKREEESNSIVGREELSAFLANSTDGSALLGRSAWLEDGWEYDWKVQLKGVERIGFHEWNW
jgi:hypothetical protein